MVLRRSQSSRHMLTVAPQTRVPGPVCRQAVMTQLSVHTVLLQMEAIMAPRKYFWKNDSVLTAGAAGCNHSVIEVLGNISATSIPRGAAIRRGCERRRGKLSEGKEICCPFTSAVWADATLITAVCRGASVRAPRPQSRHGSVHSYVRSWSLNASPPGVRQEVRRQQRGAGQRSPQELFEVPLLLLS